MSMIIETLVYSLDELSDEAKDRARAWYRDADPADDWSEAVFTDFETLCDILGLTLRTDPVPLMGGGVRREPRIFFRGFWSQGDGALFEATYSYRKHVVRRIREHAPEDRDLQAIADALFEVQRRNFYQLRAEVRRRGRGCDETALSVSVERDSPTFQDATDDAEDTVTEALRDLARWLYGQLEREYAYLTSDPVVDETILANEYSFTETGCRFG
ncbi:antitoxin of toxin-antitoxin stability system [Rhodospirillum sp. A1_3_36]|uniref:antitoxin of toxin-antitoxin stability system n=1 Tax=Rhodospirillum sp. A1_3_36 TaxID=3391666 RepID=UPI0039A6037F